MVAGMNQLVQYHQKIYLNFTLRKPFFKIPSDGDKTALLDRLLKL